MTMTTTTAIETHREGNTYYAFADSGEMIASGPGQNSLANEIGFALEKKGQTEAMVDGRLVSVADLKAQGW